eukprot:s34_g13.t1
MHRVPLKISPNEKEMLMNHSAKPCLWGVIDGHPMPLVTRSSNGLAWRGVQRSSDRSGSSLQVESTLQCGLWANQNNLMKTSGIDQA